MPESEPLRRQILRRQRPRVVGAALCLIGHQSCEALVPVAIGLSIDGAVAGGEPSTLLLALGGLVALFAALTLCYRWFARLGHGAVIDESHRLRAALAARVLAPGASARRHGELLTIASSDADQAAKAIIGVSGVVGASAALVVSCAVLLTIDLRLGALLIATAVVVALALGAISPLLSRRVGEQQRMLAGASALATDLVTGLRVVHGLGAQQVAAERYRAVSREAEAAGIRAGAANALQLGASVLGATAVLAVSVAAAGFLALDGAITIGAFVAAVGAAQFISEPLTAIGAYLQVGAAAKASAGRVRGALEARDDAAEPAAALPPVEVSLGELVGVVADQEDLEAVVAALRAPAGARVHVEPHRPDLFAGSVADNLALGRLGLDRDQDPMPAVDAAGARELVEALPEGLGAHVRDRGLSLSGGQRQRLVLARALHADPAALVLVEPTSAVDPVTEQRVADGLRALRHGDGPARATVVVTSSPVLLDRTDRVVVVRDGVLVAGTHRGLLAGDAAYRARVLG